eukprot:ANDGO_06103.mRNA.1 hypothetical protein
MEATVDARFPLPARKVQKRDALWYLFTFALSPVPIDVFALAEFYDKENRSTMSDRRRHLLTCERHGYDSIVPDYFGVLSEESSTVFCTCGADLAANAASVFFEHRQTVHIRLLNLFSDPVNRSVDLLQKVLETPDDSSLVVYDVTQDCASSLGAAAAAADSVLMKLTIRYDVPLDLFYMSCPGQSSMRLDMRCLENDGVHRSALILAFHRSRAQNRPILLDESFRETSIVMKGDCTVWQEKRGVLNWNDETASLASELADYVKGMDVCFTTGSAVPSFDSARKLPHFAMENDTSFHQLSITEFHPQTTERKLTKIVLTERIGTFSSPSSRGAGARMASPVSTNVSHHMVSLFDDRAIVLGRQHFNASALARRFLGSEWEVCARRVSPFAVSQTFSTSTEKELIELDDLQGHLLVWSRNLASVDTVLPSITGQFVYIHNISSDSPALVFYDVSHYNMFVDLLASRPSPFDCAIAYDAPFACTFPPQAKCAAESAVFSFVVVPPRGGLVPHSNPRSCFRVRFYAVSRVHDHDNGERSAKLGCLRREFLQHEAKMTLFANAVALHDDLFFAYKPVVVSGYGVEGLNVDVSEWITSLDYAFAAVVDHAAHGCFYSVSHAVQQ